MQKLLKIHKKLFTNKNDYDIMNMLGAINGGAVIAPFIFFRT